MKTIFSIFYLSLYSVLTMQAQNIWIRKANYGGDSTHAAVGFSIGNKGYLGTGSSPLPGNEFWEYNPVTDTWTQKANFPGIPRYEAVGFSIGNKGYIGLGQDTSGYANLLTDFWEYNQASNSWTQITNFPGAGRVGAIGFCIGNYGYVGTGGNNSGYLDDFWEYNPTTNSWIQKANFGGGIRYDAVGFTISNKGYVGTGTTYNGSFITTKDFWEYDPLVNSWSQKTDFGGSNTTSGVGFTILNKGYICAGTPMPNIDFWEYDPATDTWTQKSNFAGTPKIRASGFGIGNKGYVGLGYCGTCSGIYLNEFWEYSPDSVPLNLPTANFTSGDSSFCFSGCVSFSDQSSNSPISWLWSFPGASPSTSTDQNPSNICYSMTGIFDVTLIVTNPFGADTIQRSGYISVGVPQIPIITRSFDTLQCSLGVTYQWLFYGDTIPGAINESLITTQDGIYSVIVVDSNGCQSTSALFDFSTGIKEVHSIFTVAPNPVIDYLILQSIGTNNRPYKFKIVTTLGMVYKEGLITNDVIDVSDLPSQLYLINMISNHSSVSLMFIKQ